LSISVTDTISGSITVTDNQSGSIAQALSVVASYVGQASEYYSNFTATSGGSVVALPVSPVEFAYIKNTSATVACNVTWTVNGGSSAVVLKLDPGAFILFCENSTGSGITALTLTSASTNVAVQMILAG
jgi:hypothetical protein